MEKITSFDIGYDRGYFKALLDINNWFEYHSADLKFTKAYTAKRVPVLLKAFVENSDYLKEYGEYTTMKVDKDWTKATLLPYKP